MGLGFWEVGFAWGGRWGFRHGKMNLRVETWSWPSTMHPNLRIALGKGVLPKTHLPKVKKPEIIFFVRSCLT